MTQKLQGNYNNKLDEYRKPLNKTEMHILRFLSRRPGRNISEISRAAKSVSESTIRKHVNQLKDKDMLQATSRDGYIVTDKAVQKLEQSEDKT